MTSNSDRNQTQTGSGSGRGFASMDEDKQREIASKGGKASHEKGTAHEFTSEEARQAGHKGGQSHGGGSTGQTTTPGRTKNDAIKLLTDDHDKVKKLFKEFEKISKKQNGEGKEELAAQICKELTVHAQLEEEIFYPAVREAIDDDELMNEALVEHGSAKDLIAQIEAMAATDPMYDAVVNVLGEYINHHVAEEQNEMFPKAQKSKMDLEEVGLEMIERKKELVED